MLSPWDFKVIAVNKTFKKNSRANKNKHPPNILKVFERCRSTYFAYFDDNISSKCQRTFRKGACSVKIFDNLYSDFDARVSHKYERHLTVLLLWFVFCFLRRVKHEWSALLQVVVLYGTISLHLIEET